MESSLAAVVIGRNEGERLTRCLSSLRGHVDVLVYVDSGSTDGSVENARTRGANVVELDMQEPFTAARARNAGFFRALELLPEMRAVQFVDGDCEIESVWLQLACEYLATHPTTAVVAGHLRERHPEASVFNRVLDMEWHQYPGEIMDCGGNAMVRSNIFSLLDGFQPGMIAGEEQEFCLRVRRAGYRVIHLDARMADHDAAMFHFGQWWRRQYRTGHSYAEVLHRQRHDPQRETLRNVLSILFWGGGLPVISLAGAWPSAGGTLLVLFAYVWPWIGSYRDRLHRGDAPRYASLYASACLLGKLPQFQGLLSFARSRLARGRVTALIEARPPSEGP